ncbi:hypothetical protein EDB86DRAFT_2955924 [Lactarius hatsudake]|nr:hypothetical protein EDB86DRAFT_2955924 [Lactarius hatsudake]
MFFTLSKLRLHAAYIIGRGGIPVVISSLVEDCISLTVANLPVASAGPRPSSRHARCPPSTDPQAPAWVRMRALRRS